MANPRRNRRNLESDESFFSKSAMKGFGNRYGKEYNGFLRLPKILGASEDITGTQKLIWMILADHVRPSGKGLCCPKLETICRLSGLHRRKVIRDLSALRKAFMVDWEKQSRTNHYYLSTADDLCLVAKAVASVIGHPENPIAPKKTIQNARPEVTTVSPQDPKVR